MQVAGKAMADIPLPPDDAQRARKLLCALGDHVRDTILRVRTVQAAASFAQVSRESLADTIYQIDSLSEEPVAMWFEEYWPKEWPVELVMEGLEGAALFPRGIEREETRWKCIIDPIDGTRGLMYDKRSAWSLAALAPQRGGETKLSDIFVAAMTELPVTKQWRADQISGVRGSGVVAEFVNVFDQTRHLLRLAPSQAKDFRHSFASLAKFFPEGKQLIAEIEEKLWGGLYGIGRTHAPLIFDDQYISTGGQFYELLSGHDRMIGDLRPLVYKARGIQSSLVCHPYDVCAALVLEEAGVIFETPDGADVDAPLDTTSAVSWIGYANRGLAEVARPVLQKILRQTGCL
jgi:hypothetical protein